MQAQYCLEANQWFLKSYAQQRGDQVLLILLSLAWLVGL